MITETLPLGPPSGRTNYEDGYVLSAAALERDATDLETAGCRHQAIAHGGQILAGLHVSLCAQVEAGAAPRPQHVYIGPGAAIAGDGAILLFGGGETAFSVDLKTDKDIWLTRTRSTVQYPGSNMLRQVESTSIEVSEHLDTDSADALSNDRIRLASLKWDGQIGWLVDQSVRHYAAAVGGRVAAPSGRTQMLLGPEHPDDTRRFAIGVETLESAAQSGNRQRRYADVLTWEKTESIRLKSTTYLNDPSTLAAEARNNLPVPVANQQHKSAVLELPYRHRAQFADSVTQQVPPRGIIFRESRVVEKEAAAGRLHLVQQEVDGKLSEQLRITIHNPGTENNPQRYRCSLGTSICQHAPQPTVDDAFWNGQTGWTRGILSILADGSVDICKQLNVNPRLGRSDTPGLILRLKGGAETAAAAAAGASGTTGSGSVPAQILTAAMAMESFPVTRNPATRLKCTGIVRSLSSTEMTNLQLTLSVFIKGEAEPPRQTISLVAKQPLNPLTSALVSVLFETDQVPLDPAFNGRILIVYANLTGIIAPHSIATTDSRAEL